MVTKRGNIDKVIRYMEKNSFFERSCHRHHGYSGGLFEHAWQTNQVAIYLKNEIGLQGTCFKPKDEDSIAISAILHDICNCDGMSDIRGHGRRFVKILEKLGLQLKNDEFLAIRFHMGLHSKQIHRLYDKAKSVISFLLSIKLIVYLLNQEVVVCDM